jgi:cytochrome P450
MNPFEVLFNETAAADPHAAYAQLRSSGPVARGEFLGGPAAVITRYDDVLWALRHPEVFSSAGEAIDLGQEVPLLPLQVDPPEHGRYRRFLNARFVPRAVGGMEPAVRARASALVDAVAGEGRCDFHTDISTPLPSGLFLPLLGLPEEDLPRFLDWRDQTIRPAVDMSDPGAADRARAAASVAIHEYFVEALSRVRRDGGTGLLADLVTATVDDEVLTDVELLGVCHLLLLGGLDTVTATLDCAMVHLAGHPEQRAELTAHPARWPAAIEELLRHQSPVQIVPRLVIDDVTMGGVELRAGDRATLVLGAANVDPEAWDEAESVDLGRDAARHLAFGGGHHLCLGMHLARLELSVTLEEWHARIPDYRIEDGAVLRFSPGIRQTATLPLTW